MNTKKHKNKKVNQQANLSNPQKDDTKVSDTLIDSQILDLKSESKGESVQEKTDNVLKEVKEQQEIDIAPKKPKRKKGKKKEIKGEECENEEDKLSKPTEIERITETDNVHADLPEVIPVRKKKNKKKGGDIKGEKMPIEEHKLDSSQLQEEVQTECKIKQTNTILPNIETIEEVKIAKKKNKKKKNRTDSEKSDKSVEVISCTSTFQKLLDTGSDGRSQDDIREPDIELVSNENINTFDIPPVANEAKSDDFLQKLEENKPTSITELDSPTKQNRKSETLEIFECKCDSSQKQLIEETPKKTLVIEEITKDIVENPESFVNKEDSLKCNAKIAKPVNKKRKEPGLQIPIESACFHETVSQAPCVGEAFEKVVGENLPVEKIKADNITMTENEDIKGTKHSVIAPQATSRNRESKGNEKTLLQANIQKQNMEADQEVAKNELLFETLVPSDFALKSSDDKVNEILSTITIPIKNTENKDIIKKTEKTRKKGKKVPKILINPETSTTTTDISKESENIKTDGKCSVLTPIDEIEIRSVKADESEGSACDVTPEILYPRSTSEHIRDNNNNTVIQEVFEDTINTPVMYPNVPLIQGSGETPTETPEAISSGIKLVEIESIATNVEDKTDIRSKMMEVNKDMEDLKSSIEKSLAGLTALEKKEEISEKLFVEKHDLNVNNKKPVESDDMMVQNIISEDTPLKARDATHEEDTNVVTLSTRTTTISQEDVRSTDYHDTEKLSVEVDQLKFEDTTQIATKVDESTLKNEQLKQDNTDTTPPICPARRDNKKGKKRKGRQDVSQTTNTNQSPSSQTSTQDAKDKGKSEQNTETATQTGKKQSSTHEEGQTAVTEDDNLSNMKPITNDDVDYEPIENFEDALTSSADDINQTFEMIVNQMTEDSQQDLAIHKPEINIIAPVEDSEEKDAKENPVTPPKNLLGHPNIPVRSNKTDYKKEKDKSPDTEEAKVKIKDSVEIENNKESKESQTEKKREEKQKKQLKDEEYFCQISNCDDYIYKYSFRRVFLQSTCHICKKELTRFRMPCKFCSLVFYCSIKHKDDDWPKHQALCFAISTIVHIKGQKHIYADAKNITGHNYRLLRMQAILACEKVLKRRLVPWEQEVLLYPRMCADVSCREWRQSKLKDCEGCGQISYCSANADHLPKCHQRWCKSYLLYQKLVIYQQTKGRLEPKLPSRVLKERQMPEKINEVLASMFEEKIDLNDTQYAALTQIATAPLTVAFCHQIYRSKMKYNSTETNKMSPFVIHVVGAELQFEADVLNKWEVFFLHVRPDVKELSVVLISPDLNPGKLPLDLLGSIRVCEGCRQDKRRVVFSFQDKKTYQEYRNSNEFIYPDIVCAFNPNLHRSSVYNGKDPWPSTINAVMTLKSPFLITSHTISELHRDLGRVKEFTDLEVLVDPRPNPFSSVRPDRNFLSDDEVPLLFKNHCYMMLLGL